VCAADAQADGFWPDGQVVDAAVTCVALPVRCDRGAQALLSASAYSQLTRKVNNISVAPGVVRRTKALVAGMAGYGARCSMLNQSRALRYAEKVVAMASMSADCLGRWTS